MFNSTPIPGQQASAYDKSTNSDSNIPTLQPGDRLQLSREILMSAARLPRLPCCTGARTARPASAFDARPCVALGAAGYSQDGVRAATVMPLRAYRSSEGTPEECRRDRIQALVKAHE
jgi:hypothetical protein